MPRRNEMFTGTMPVREAHRLDPARRDMYMAEQIEGFEGALEIAQFRGGQSYSPLTKSSLDEVGMV